MTLARVNLTDPGGQGSSLTNYNILTDSSAVGLVVADMVDDTGAATGWTLTQNGAFSGRTSSGSAATSAPSAEFPVEFYQGYFYANSTDEASATFTVGNLPVGADYTIRIAGAAGNTGRDTNFSATDSTPTSVLYDLTGKDPVDPPVELTGTVPAGGEITISQSLVSVFGYQNGWSLEVIEASSAPTLDTVPATAYPGESVSVAVSNAGATQGTGGITIGGVAQTVTAWSDTSVTFTVVQGNLKYEAGKTIELTTDGGQTASGTIDLIVEPGTGGYIDVVSPETTDTSAFAYQAEDAGGNPVATGDQFEWRYTGTPGDPTSMTVQADTLPSSVDAEGDVDGRFWDATDSTWGSWYTFTTDATAPTVSSVSVPTAGTYAIGENLDLTANASEAVTVTTTGGTPSIPVTVGATVRQADYVSGSGTSALLFRYTVQQGDEDTDGISVGSAISLNGGTMQDAAGNDLTLTLNSIGSTTGVLVDGIRPVVSINPLTTLDTSPIVSGSAGDAASLTLVVTGVGTYTPTPSGGTWSQQLPTLALGDYAMTLNGTDAVGNAAVEDAATLRIVNEIPVMRGRPGFHMKMSMGF